MAVQLRFGVLTSGETLAPWQRMVLTRLAATDGVGADSWLLAPAPAVDAPANPFAVASAEAPVERRAWFAGLPTIRLAAPHDGPTALEAQSLQTVRGRRLDFILSFAGPALGRTLVSGARLGVWQFFFGDWSRYHGESDGRLEIIDDVGTCSAILAQLQPDADTVRILREGCVRAHPFSSSAHLGRLQQKGTHWPAQVCLDVLDGADDLTTRPLVHSPATPGHRPRLSGTLAYAARAAVRVVRDQLQTFLRHDQWSIGLINAPIDALLASASLPEVRWLRQPRRHEFLADPFGVRHDGRITVLCEQFDHRHGRGVIVALPADEPVGIERVLIGPPVHLSYPFVFEHQGTLFCIPETNEALEVALYEVERFPNRWRRVATLVAGLPLLDATPFSYESRWWLAASLPVSRGANDELHLWHAESLLGPWRPHAGNPVKVDVRSARPGGTPFLKDEVLYRPAQDCSIAYGGRVVINRVLTLTPRSFREVAVATVEPPATGPYRRGLHTLSAVGPMTLVDSKRSVFVPAAFARTLGRALRRGG